MLSIFNMKKYAVCVDIASIYVPVKANSKKEAIEQVNEYITWDFIEPDLDIVNVGEFVEEVEQDEEYYKSHHPNGEYQTNFNEDTHEEWEQHKEDQKKAITTEIKISWSIDDVLMRAEEQGIKITRKQASNILNDMKRQHDASIGISWDTIDAHLDALDYEVA